MTTVTYKTNGQFENIAIDSHIDSHIDVNYFEKTASCQEFICVSHYDRQSKESIKFFVTGDALDQFIEKMSVICALRFKNKGSSV